MNTSSGDNGPREDTGASDESETQEFDALQEVEASLDDLTESESWFIEFTGRRFQIPTTIAASLVKDARQSGEQPHQLALLRGVFDAAQTSIIETLQKPRDTLKDFEFQDVLGRGGMGVVYLARQISLDRAVAVKTILAGSKSGPDRFEAEGRTIARLRHPNIVAAYDLIRQGGRLYLVLELLEGESLEERLDRQQTMPEILTWQLIRQAAAGLLYAAGENVVHRDIKPGNLYLTQAPPGFPLPDGVPLLKLTDFGLAALIDRTTMEDEMRLTAHGKVLGTPAYMAPEQLSTSEVDHRADIYALGATAHHMMSGKPPFAGEPFTRLLVRKSSEPPPQISSLQIGISAASSELVARLLQTSPDDRPQTYEEVIREIDALLPVLEELDTGSGDATDAETRVMSALPGSNTVVQSTSITDRQVADDSAESDAAPAPAGNGKFRLLMFAAIAACLVAVIAGAAIWLAGPAETPVYATRMRPAGAAMMLFNGESLAGWKASRGVTRPAIDAEGGSVLEINGAAVRPLPASPWFSLSMGVDLQQGEGFELYFAAADASAPPGFIVSIDRSTLRVMKHTAPQTAIFEQALPAGTWSGDGSEPSYHTLTIHREPGQWVIALGETGVNLPPHTRDVATKLIMQTRGSVLLEGIEFSPLQPIEAAAGENTGG